jgi:hypothetical protein
MLLALFHGEIGVARIQVSPHLRPAVPPVPDGAHGPQVEPLSVHRQKVAIIVARQIGAKRLIQGELVGRPKKEFRPEFCQPGADSGRMYILGATVD